MATAAENIRQLLALINSAAEEAIKQYEDSGHGVPSLDAVTEPKLPEDAIPLRRALRVLEGACNQLCTTLAPPDVTMYTRTLVPVDMACIRVVVNTKVADILEEYHDGMAIQALADRTNVESSKLLRIMRNLASKHCFREVKREVFANNALSMTLREEHPLYSLVALRSNVLNQLGTSSFFETLMDPEYGHSFATHRAPFMYSQRQEMPDATFWDWLRVNPKSSELFNKGLMVLAKISSIDRVVQDFPWRSLPKGATVCDVGSGLGTVTLELAKAYPHLQLTLQDRPCVLKQARKVWRKKYPNAEAEDRVEFNAFDFFKEVPATGQDIYFLRQITHDWSSEDCVVILKNVRAAMKPGSRVLIHEYILPPSVMDQNSADEIAFQPAPEPLLPGYGFGANRVYLQDMTMLILQNSGERTLLQIKTIGAEAGLTCVKVWDFVETALVEFMRDVDTISTV